MKSIKLKSFLLGTTVFCVLSLPAFSDTVPLNSTTDSRITNLETGIFYIQEQNNAGKYGPFEYTIPTTATETIFEEKLSNTDWNANTIVGMQNPTDLIITGGGQSANQTIQGTLNIANKQNTNTAKGSLTINNVGSYNGTVPTDYKNWTAGTYSDGAYTGGTIKGHIENLANYIKKRDDDLQSSSNSEGKTAIGVPDTPAVYLEDADLNVTNSIFAYSNTQGSSSTQNQGAAVYVGGTSMSKGVTADISGSTFAFNKTNDSGAAINIDKADLTVDNATIFIGNEAALHGGAIDVAGTALIDGTKTTTLNGQQTQLQNIFYNNTASAGGAIYVHDRRDNSATATSEKSRVESRENIYDSNVATSAGGAVQNNGVFVSINDIFISNTAGTQTTGDDKGNGGAIANTTYTYDASATNTPTAQPGEVHVTGGLFKQNEAEYDGGAIYNKNGGTTTIVGSTNFEQNEAGRVGGAIYNGGELYLKNKADENYSEKSEIDFTQNTSNGAGGAIENNTGGTVKSAGVTYTQNTAATYGGAIDNSGSYTSVNGDTFIGNTAGKDGGAIYNYTGATYTSNGDVFKGNTATQNGGAVANVGGTYSSSGATYGATGTTNSKSNGNTATQKGGAIYNGLTKSNAAGTATSKNDTFTNNSATQGGAVANSGGSFTADNDTFKGNTATQDGGAIYNEATLIVKNGTTFSGNTATSSGGAIYNAGTASLSGTKFQKDTAGNKNQAATGGAIYNAGTITSVSGTYDSNSATQSGGAIHNAANGSYTGTTETFKNNIATQSGGAVYNLGTFETKDTTTFENNQASTGGAVYNKKEFKTSGSTTFKGNNTTSNAGAVLNDTGATYTSSARTTFDTNKTKGHGGAVYNKGTYTSANTTYSGNIAGYQNSTDAQAFGGAIYNYTDATYTSNGDVFTGNTAKSGGGAIYNAGTFNLYNAANSSFTGNTVTNVPSSKKSDSTAIYNTTTGTFTIKGANDTIDLLAVDWDNYDENTTIPTISSHKHLFADGQTIRNLGTLNITDSVLQLHQHSNLKDGVININGDKTGTVKLNNSTIDIGKSTLYTNSVSFTNNSRLLTHVNAKSYTDANPDSGQIATNTVSFDNTNNKLTIFVNAGEHLNEGESKIVEIIKTDNTTHTGDFKEITENKMYEITALGDGKYELKRPGGVTPEDPKPEDPKPEDPKPEDPKPEDPNWDPTKCPNGNCIHKAWVEHSKIVGHTKAEQIQSTLNDAAQELGCDSEEYKKALTGVAPDVSPLIQAHSTEITRRLAGIISKQLYSSMERTGYIHRGKRFYKFPRRQSHLWVQGMYGQSEYDSKKGFDMDTQGLAVGFDGHISPDTRLGVAYAYTSGDGTAVQRDTEVQSHTLSVYGEYNPNRFYTNWLALYTRSQYEENKKVFQHRIKADYDVDVFGAQIMFGNKMGPFVVGDWASGVLSPEVGLRYTYIKQHGYTDDAGQKVGAADGHILTGILGAQYTIGYTLAPGLAWYPELRAALTYDFVQPDMENSVTLVNGAQYNVVTENLDKFGIEIGARVGLDINRKTEVALEYEGLFKGDYTNHTGLASLKYKF